MIIQAAADEAFNYYLDQSPLVNDRHQLPANPSQPADEITQLLAADMATHPRLWLVAQTFPDWPSAGIVERWLAENAQRIRATTVQGLRVEEYRPWRVSEAEPSGRELATFSDIATLAGVRIEQDMGDQNAAVVILYWRPLRQSAAPLKVSVQLIGPLNPATGTPLWSQDDQFPQAGRADTTVWTPGEVLRDIHLLPLADVPPGQYQVVVRLYDAASGERLPTGADDGATVATLVLP